MEALRTNKKITLIIPKGLIDMCEARLWKITYITTISGCVNLVPAFPHTASSETSIRALLIDVERASSAGIFLAA